MDRKPRRRLFGLLRRQAPPPRADRGAESRSDVENELWRAQGHVTARARDAAEAAQRLASGVARQRGAIDASLDRTRLVASRGQELMGAIGRTQELFDRLGLVALNAGLEGARLGEGLGRALLLVAEEVRGLAQRGADASRELAAALEELGAEWMQVSAQLASARDLSGDVSQEAARTASACAEVERAATELEQGLRASLGTDPETARAVGHIAEHGRMLVAALGSLRGRVPRAVLLSALSPIVEPLAMVLEELRSEPGERR